MGSLKPKKTKKIVNSLVRSYLNYRHKRIIQFMEQPSRIQHEVRNDLITQASNTAWGRIHGYSTIKNYKDFSQRIPIQNYEDLQPYIHRMMMGESDILWPGVTTQFAKSSGTTNDKSKFIPVSKESTDDCHIQGSWDVVVLFYQLRQNAALFLFKNIILPGSISYFDQHPQSQIGDISALMAYNMPALGRAFYEPSLDIALLPNWEEKIERSAQLLYKRDDVGMFGGVPTWNLILFRRILELAKKDNLLELWPNLQAYFHGGVGFGPYRQQFEELIPSDDFRYLEVYNASEGFFAVQNDFSSHDMLLLLDNGVFFEFMPLSEFGSSNPIVLPIEEVELGIDYAVLISTNAGLWRYHIGDTVQFTSLRPYKIIISGRTKQFINVFGEELMVHNAEKALSTLCKELNVTIAEYTVGPRFFTSTEKGGHHWVIEFEKRPIDIEAFADRLDMELQQINSDYEAKRFKGMALERLALTEVPKGTFFEWMKSRNKIGVQNKVPRLSNTREYVNAILEFVANK